MVVVILSLSVTKLSPATANPPMMATIKLIRINMAKYRLHSQIKPCRQRCQRPFEKSVGRRLGAENTVLPARGAVATCRKRADSPPFPNAPFVPYSLQMKYRPFGRTEQAMPGNSADPSMYHFSR